jgi:hypothetical protein
MKHQIDILENERRRRQNVQLSLEKRILLLEEENSSKDHQIAQLEKCVEECKAKSSLPPSSSFYEPHGETAFSPKTTAKSINATRDTASNSMPFLSTIDLKAWNRNVSTAPILVAISQDDDTAGSTTASECD